MDIEPDKLGKGRFTLPAWFVNALEALGVTLTL